MTDKPKYRILPVREVIPDHLKSLFSFRSFNLIQSLLFNQAFHSDENMIVAAPTGSGKTIIHELAICRLLMNIPKELIKCLYIAPNKALCQQRFLEWKEKFESIGLSILEVTGDVELPFSLKAISKTNIIVTTPEKWDSLTRYWRENVFILGEINLFLIDEIHHLGEERGAVLETVIVRMNLIHQISKQKGINYEDTTSYSKR